MGGKHFLRFMRRHERGSGARHHQRLRAAAGAWDCFWLVSPDGGTRGDSRGAAVRIALAVSECCRRILFRGRTGGGSSGAVADVGVAGKKIECGLKGELRRSSQGIEQVKAFVSSVDCALLYSLYVYLLFE